MIHQFDKKRRVLFFPTSWANSVASWCAGVSSPTGTIRIKNTLTPKEGGVSLEIDINEERIASLALHAVETRTQFSDTERNLIKGMFQGATDQKVLTYRNDLFGIDMEALRKNLGLDEGESATKLQENQTDASTAGKSYDISTEELLAEKAPQDVYELLVTDKSGTTETNDSKIKRIGTSSRAAREDHQHLFPYHTGASTQFAVWVESTGGDDYPSGTVRQRQTLGWERGVTGTWSDWATSSGNPSQTSTAYDGVRIQFVSRIERSSDYDILYLRYAYFDKNGCLYKIDGEAEKCFYVCNKNFQPV